jgi:hypothetical protein
MVLRFLYLLILLLTAYVRVTTFQRALFACTFVNVCLLNFAFETRRNFTYKHRWRSTDQTAFVLNVIRICAKAVGHIHTHIFKSHGMKGYKIKGIRYLTRTQVLTVWKLLRLRKPQTEVSALPAVLESTHFLEARWVCRTVVLASTSSHLPGRCTVFSVVLSRR